MYRELVAVGEMEDHLLAKGREAHAMKEQLMAGDNSLPREREAEEQVRAVLIEFPPENVLTAP